MDFLKEFEKSVSKMDGVTSQSGPPRFWYSSGNYVLNKITSGSFYNCCPQSRILALCGNSGSGKSFVATNLMVNAQKAGAFNFVIDSENALDDDFVGKIGVDVTDKYLYKSVTTISEVSALVSAFIKGYKKQYSSDLLNGQAVHITIDSLDMLLTETEEENYDKGLTKGDMGQRAKQLKAMLRTFVQSIKGTNITMVVTSQVYANQDIKNGEGMWIVNSAIKYSMSQIILITKLKLKDKDDAKIISGIRMRCNGYKTRFTKPFQTVEIEVPYDTGMDPLSGLLDVAINSGIVKQGGAWYTIISTDQKFQRKNLSEYADTILNELEVNNTYLMDESSEEDIDNVQKLASTLRNEKYNKSVKSDDAD